MMRTAAVAAVALAITAGLAWAADPPRLPPAAPAPSDPQTAEIQRQVAAADAGAGRAIGSKSYADLDRYWTPEFVVNGPGNRVLTRAEVIAAIREGKLDYRGYHNVVELISASGDNVIEMGHEDYVPVTGPEAGKRVYRRYTQFYVRRRGTLLLLARQATIYDPTVIHY